MQNILPTETNNMCNKLLIGVLSVYIIRSAYIRYLSSSNFVDSPQGGGSFASQTDATQSKKSGPDLEEEPDWESMDFREYTETILATL